MGFTSRFGCRQNEKHDLLTLLITRSSYRLKIIKGASETGMFWVDFFLEISKRREVRLFGTEECQHISCPKILCDLQDE